MHIFFSGVIKSCVFSCHQKSLKGRDDIFKEALDLMRPLWLIFMVKSNAVQQGRMSLTEKTKPNRIIKIHHG